MIDSKDLRIGNCYLTGLEVIGSRLAKLNINESRVIKLNLNHFHIFSQAKELIQCLYPIKLTPEILLQIGLKKEGNLFCTTDYSGICFEFKSNIQWTCYRKTNNGLIELTYGFEYLHDIQNIYYTNNNKQELPIDINTLKI